MREWLAGEYKAIPLSRNNTCSLRSVSGTEQEIYLRQLFVVREKRHQGIGREAVRILRERVWPQTKRLTVEVLTANHMGVGFWRAVGYKIIASPWKLCPGNRVEED